MYLKHGDKNTAVIINSMTNNGKQLIMVQKFIPKAVYGDKKSSDIRRRNFTLLCSKTPSNDDFKFCEHDDEHIKKLCFQTTKLINSKTCSKIKFNGHLYGRFRCN